MSSVLMPFSIHQERWHNAWVAATAAVKSRKKQQVDFDIQRRVVQLLEEYGPQSEAPLTLRVYGTLLKGFCILNNERSRALYTDCERVMLMVAQRKTSEEEKNLKLPAAKRQRTDALTLDLDLSKVHDAEVFNWTQAPLEDGALLQLNSDLAVVLPEAQSLGQAPLLDDALLVSDAFSTADLPLVPLEDVAEAVRLAEAADAAAAAERLRPSAEAGNAFPPVNEVEEVQDVPSILQEPALLVGEIADALGDPKNVPGSAPRPKRIARAPPPLPGAGHVFGFDEHTLLSNEQFDEWQLSEYEIGGFDKLPEEYEEDMIQNQQVPVDRLALLYVVLEPTLASRAFAEGALAVNAKNSWGNQLPPASSPLEAEVNADGGLPEVQALLSNDASEQNQQDMVAIPEIVSALEKALDESMNMTALDPFRPYVPEKPLKSLRGADMELAGFLSAQGSTDQGEDVKDVEIRYDLQTAQVAGVLHRYMEKSSNASRNMTLDDLIPPNSTDKEVAAKTFLAVLTLATAGDFRAEQPMPYGAITISLP